MTGWNRVTEKPAPPSGGALWLLHTQWRGGHDRRVVSLQKLYLSKSEALKDWEEATPENHNKKLGFPADFDAGFIRHPLRSFVEEP
jgi:hypothetical protein